MRFLSVCSGMEAASVAWEPLGWKAVGFSEIEPFPCAILKHRFPNTPNYGSLTEYQSWPIEPGAIDLLVGGTPCQSFSVAGLRKGMQDPRGNLALTFLGLADKLRPRWIVWENVPGVLSSNGGRDFGSFVGALGQLGYGWAMRVLDAQHFGVPQRRRRVFVVGCLGSGELAASVLLKPESVCWHPAKGRKKGKGVASGAEGGIGADDQLIGGIDYEHNAHGPSDVTGPLLKGSPTGGGHPLPAIAYRKSKRAQSTTDDETWVVADESNTLNNFDLGDTRTTHAVVGPVAWTQNQRDEVRILGDKAAAIALPGTHQTNYIAIQGTIIGRGENAGPQGTGATEGGPMFTLTKTDIHGVAHHMPGNVAPTVTSSGPPYSRTGNERVEAEALAITLQPCNLRRDAGADPSTEATTTLKASAGDQMPHVATPMAVRRLTPVECERLQGFPDNWSRIPWKGKPEEDCPDGPRYKACGNSMAVPVMRWIGEQIVRVEAETR